MTQSQDYFKLGYQIIDFNTTRLAAAVDSALSASLNDDKKFTMNFSMTSKYADSSDFRPSPVMHSEHFVQTLFDNSIIDTLNDIVGSRDLTLIHCQLRAVHGNSNVSYMPWHRDTYFSNGNWIGNTPPVHKIIVYFDGPTKNEPRLHIIPGSHRKMFDDHDMDVKRYSAEIEAGKYETVYSSHDHALLFNTALLHSVIPERSSPGSIRIIYSFATQEQYEKTYKGETIHRIANTQFESTKRWKGFT